MLFIEATLASKNLWIYEKQTERKRYSITTTAGAKIQPYFDVPPQDDPNVYLFTVIGEQFNLGKIRVWLTPATAKELEQAVGSLDAEEISDAILRVVGTMPDDIRDAIAFEETGVSILLRADAYTALIEKFQGVSDEHCFRLFVEHLVS